MVDGVKQCAGMPTVRAKIKVPSTFPKLSVHEQRTIQFAEAIYCQDANKKAAAEAGAHISLVAPTGFEPVISALRGRCPWPLDEGALWLAIQDSNLDWRIQSPLSYR